MKIFGIDFLLDEPFHTKFAGLVVGSAVFLNVMAGPLCLVLFIHLLSTRVWWIILLYFGWIYFDRNICENGGRAISWAQKLSYWSYFNDYFSTQVIPTPDFNLDPKRNYLFCCFPHGILPFGAACNISFGTSKFQKLYPHFQVKTAAIPLLFYFPFTRELGLALGGISCSAKSLYYWLKQPAGGYIVSLFLGGAEEAIYAGKQGKHKFIVKKRKGFVKVALKSGVALVPVITFDETGLYTQIQTPLIMKIQLYLRSIFSFVPVLFTGRGLFQNSFGLIPRKKQLVTVLGKPIDVVQTENPTNGEIENLHQKFIKNLVDLFEKYKYEFLENPEETFLELE